MSFYTEYAQIVRVRCEEHTREHNITCHSLKIKYEAQECSDELSFCSLMRVRCEGQYCVPCRSRSVRATEQQKNIKVRTVAHNCVLNVSFIPSRSVRDTIKNK